MDRIPILKMGDLLLITIQFELHDRLIMTLQNDLMHRILETGARGVLIDISALDLVDSFTARMLATSAEMARMMDSETAVVGMQPAVAITLVELGLSFHGIHTALNIEKGIELLNRISGPPAGESNDDSAGT
jgi:rsbT antagonist protein RsbS